MATSTAGKKLVSAWGVWCEDEGKFVAAFLSPSDADRHAEFLNDRRTCKSRHVVRYTSIYVTPERLAAAGG